jgi:hypothetical protein
MKMVKYKSLSWIAIVVYSVLAVGCTHLSVLRYGPDRQPREAFEHRVEAAFRLQNHMTSEVMILQEVNQHDQNEEAIFQAEQEMQKKCSYLNEYASREIDELSTGFLLLSRVEDSVADCEAAAHKVEAMLKNR